MVDKRVFEGEQGSHKRVKEDERGEGGQEKCWRKRETRKSVRMEDKEKMELNKIIVTKINGCDSSRCRMKGSKETYHNNVVDENRDR